MNNSRLIESLNRCPICGSLPKINNCYDVDKHNYIRYERHMYKLFCSESPFHVSCGDWFKNKYKACQDWNRRTVDNTQPDLCKPKRTGWIPCDEAMPTEEAWYHVLIRYENKEQGRIEYTVEQDLYSIELAAIHGKEVGFCKARRWKEREKIVAWCKFPMIPEELTKDATQVHQPYKES